MRVLLLPVVLLSLFVPVRLEATETDDVLRHLEDVYNLPATPPTAAEAERKLQNLEDTFGIKQKSPEQILKQLEDVYAL